MFSAVRATMKRKSIHTPDRSGNFEFLTLDECKALQSRFITLAYSKHTNMVHRVRITSVKTWKRRPDVEVRWKYGMYEYGVTLINPNNPNEFFVKEA